jgi:AcrR family transcriptional regulator
MRADRRAPRAKRAQSDPVRPEEVLERTAALFLSNGYHRTRMSDIAESFGVTHAALYYHFQNKQDILSQINVKVIDELLSHAKSIVDAGGPPEDRLMSLLEAHLGYIARRPAFVATLLEHDLEIPEDQFAKIQRMRREYTHLFTDMYGEARRAGAVPDIDDYLAVSLLIGACNWVYRWYDPAGDMTSDELVTQAMSLLGRVIRISRTAPPS